MREAEFKAWLGKRRYQGKALKTVGNRAGWVKAAERALPELGFIQPTLDEVYADGQWEAVLKAFSDLRGNWQINEAAARKIAPQSSDPHLQVANTRQAVGVYGRFLRGDDPNYDDGEIEEAESMSDIDRASVEAAMDEYGMLGQSTFLAKYERGLQGTRYWVRRTDTLYPSKAIANAAFEIKHGERGTYGGTEARRQLARLGFIITDRDGRPVGVEAEPAVEAQLPVSEPTNLILYGPPGTGKTFATAGEAVRLCDGDAEFPSTPEGRAALLARYRELENEKRIGFVTFHQNYDYETFVEGLRPETSGDEAASAGFRLEAKPGIFREICALADQARTRTPAQAGTPELDFTNRRFWKMGQGAIGTEDDVYEDALVHNYIALGWGGTIDWSSPRFRSFEAIKAEWLERNPDDQTPSNWTQTYPFRCEMKPGDIVIVPYGNSAFRAVAEVTGDYYFVPSAEGYYAHRRPVRWLLVLDDPLPLDTIIDGNFTMRTLYPLAGKRVNISALGRLLAGEEQPGDAEVDWRPDQFVLIIDEINRANISKVFGELITLLEPDKRLGMPNALTVRLPYSKREFGVPANLHVIGTMNTADRSIALLDTALRRRFHFRELAPDTKVAAFQQAVRDTGLPLDTVLDVINDRIEYLIDREHRIGHAFFIGCRSRADVDAVMRDKVIPLLQEYFFEDWGRVAAVLGEPQGKGGGFFNCRKLRDPTGEDGEERQSWSVRRAFATDAYDRLVGKAAPAAPAPPTEDPLDEAAE